MDIQQVKVILEDIKLQLKEYDTVDLDTLDDTELNDLSYLYEEREILEKVIKYENDVLGFAYEFFSDDMNPENENNLIPANTHISTAPDFHIELCNTLNVLSNENVNGRIGWSVPRGHAKSTYLSNVFPLHQVVYKKRKLILIVSETEGMSRRFLEFISEQLKYNEKLIRYYGRLMSLSKQENTKDNTESIVTSNNIMVTCASVGKQLRGLRFLNSRPDLVICDDLESSKNTNTKELRAKNLHFFNSVLMPIGTPEATAFVYMGTLVHGDGLLPNVLQRADFESKKYSAILQEPDRADLWERYEEIYRNQEDENRKETAEAFYKDNYEVMNEGVKTLWNRFPYHKLMQEKINIGSKAFASEFLNQPSNDEDAIFKKSYFSFFDDKDLYNADGRQMKLDIFGFWDIAVGKNSRSDYNAIITIGRDKRTGILYVLDAWAKKCSMNDALKVAEEKILEYRPKTFGVETVQAQYNMFTQLRDNLIKRGMYSTRVKAVNPRGKKEDRIEQLQPLVENGVIRFKRHQRLLQEQLELFPSATHDDLPDALASVVDITGNARKKMFYKKPTGF